MTIAYSQRAARMFPLAAIVLAVMLSTVSTHAQQPGWISLGSPEGGLVTAFARLGRVVIAGSYPFDIYRSEDDGRTWKPSPAWPGSVLSANGMAIAGDTIYVAAGYGLYSSVDSGLTWSKFPSLSTDYTSAVAIVNRQLVVGTPNAIHTFTLGDNGVADYRLTVTSGMANVIVAGPSGMFAGGAFGLIRSLDDGLTWSPRTIPGRNKAVTSIALLGNTVIVGTENEGGIFRSPDHGVTWTMVPTGMGTSVRSIVVRDSVLYASTWERHLLRSVDSGSTWTLVAGAPDGIGSIIVVPDGFVAANTLTRHILRSSDGAVWTDSERGFTALAPHVMISSGNEMLVGTEAGLVHRNATGDGWSWIDGTRRLNIRSLARLPRHLVLATGNELYLSADGREWDALAGGWHGTDLSGIATVGNTLLVASYAQIHRAVDTGATLVFRKVTTATVDVSALAVHDGLVIGTNTYYVQGSTDTGATWVYNYAPDDPLYIKRQTIFGVAGVDSMFYALTSQGLFFSRDGNPPWASVAPELDSLVIRTIVGHGGDLYIGTDRHGVLRSTNHGATWSPWNNGLGDLTIASLASGSDGLYAITGSRTIYRLATSNLGVDEAVVAGSALELGPVVPTPSTTTAAIRAVLPRSGRLSATLHDALGRVVRTLDLGARDAGEQTITFDVAGLASGVYLCRVLSGDAARACTVVVER